MRNSISNGWLSGVSQGSGGSSVNAASCNFSTAVLLAWGIASPLPTQTPPSSSRGADIRRKDCRVRQDFSPIQQRHKLLHRALQGIRPLAQCDTIRPQVVGNAHRRSSVY